MYEKLVTLIKKDIFFQAEMKYRKVGVKEYNTLSIDREKAACVVLEVKLHEMSCFKNSQPTGKVLQSGLPIQVIHPVLEIISAGMGRSHSLYSQASDFSFGSDTH